MSNSTEQVVVHDELIARNKDFIRDLRIHAEKLMLHAIDFTDCDFMGTE